MISDPACLAIGIGSESRNSIESFGVRLADEVDEAAKLESAELS